MHPKDQALLISAIIREIGDTPERPGTRETPQRVVDSWKHLFSGYGQDPAEVLKEFEPEGFHYDELICVKDVEFYSFCEHHMLPFFGKAAIAYIPAPLDMPDCVAGEIGGHRRATGRKSEHAGKIVGVSKLVRVLEIYSRRLQVQERICQQVTAALNEHLQPLGAACVLEARHFCMMCRGVEKREAVMVTSSMTGVFGPNGKPEARAELLSIIKS